MNLLTTGKLKYHNIPLNQLIPFTVPAEYHAFSKDTICAIVKTLLDIWVDKHGVFNLPNLNSFEGLRWRWSHNNVAFPNRLAKLLKSEWDFNASDSLLQEIGNMCQVDIIPSSEILFDFTSDLTWKAGDFGDKNSCFWQGRKDIRDAMSKEGNFYALRFFTKAGQPQQPDDFYMMRGLIPTLTTRVTTKYYNDKYSGVARSWLYETRVQVKLKNKVASIPALFLFNGYGMTLPVQAGILSAYLKLERATCVLKNKGKMHGGLYFNGPGFLISSDEAVKAIKYWDFNMADPYENPPTNDPAYVMRPEPGNNPFTSTYLNRIYKHPENREQRKLNQEHMGQHFRNIVWQEDQRNGKMHQRFVVERMINGNASTFRCITNNLQDKYYEKQTLQRLSPEGIDHYKGIKASMKKNGELIRKFKFDPLRVINHHIKNNLL